MKISFVGAGSMAEAIISGMTQKKLIDHKNIYVTNRSDNVKLSTLKEKYKIQTTYSMKNLLEQTDIVFLAVKPKDAKDALLAIRPYLHSTTLVISVLAGISLSFIESIVDGPIIRAMPNTSAAIGKSATALAYNDKVSNEQLNITINLLSSIGKTTIVEEEKLDAITGLSGSGPAYIYYIAEAMEQSAQEIGLEKTEAKKLIIQTLLGAAEMLELSGKSPADLRKSVTSPGGTTEAGIRVLDNSHVKEAFIHCIKEATTQSKRLAQINSKK
ncbi:MULTISPECIES: pyrroline-5-carboxylate reductase [Heyndrickxia]|uniref:pyrroline-5-carboxylate reductase n=1 Tax=Heyndrickxia TaxID=2837504 RepID=UPI000D352A3D|nr:pyrroline-5-carboxylate reductase [Heyndrickxia sporothermodurans]PTY75940.1 pyrroline-5-carboxylate reductase [Heyndrickxia sporothermodurans]